MARIGSGIGWGAPARWAGRVVLAALVAASAGATVGRALGADEVGPLLAGASMEVTGAGSELRSEPYGGPVGPTAVGEPGGLGPLASVELNASTAGGATTVAHAREGRTMAHAAPDFASERVAVFHSPDERGTGVVFQVVGPVVDGWVEVRLPIRPNGTTGWIRTHEVAFTTNPYRIEVDVTGFELTITRGDEVVLTTPVGIGTGETPTPRGEFFLTELLRPSDPTGIYGPYAYGLSGFSDTLTSFNGGEGVIGIHGTNQPELLGTNASHGCIRVENTVIEHLVTFLPLGTPVTIG